MRALVRLALYIGLAGLALGIERIEGKIEVMLARLTGIDGAARELADGFVHVAEIPLCTGERIGWHDTHARRRVATLPLRGPASFLSSATPWRSAPMRFVTRRGAARGRLRS